MPRLDPDQEDLLVVIVEAALRQPKGQKESFFAVEAGMDSISHRYLPGGEFTEFHWPDLELLRTYGLIHGRVGRGTLQFDVSASGFDLYESVMTARGRADDRIEETVRRMLDTSQFRSRFGEASGKWSRAEQLLWGPEATEHASTIGHLCREAIQVFAVGFAQACGVTPESPDKTLNNVRLGLEVIRGSASDAQVELLLGLLEYWKAVNAIVQRQEHGATRERASLTVEDSRLTVFHSGLVMFELARVLERV
jgi:hypothetical protein